MATTEHTDAQTGNGADAQFAHPGLRGDRGVRLSPALLGSRHH
jgi:hypothetical protein